MSRKVRSILVIPWLGVKLTHPYLCESLERWCFIFLLANKKSEFFDDQRSSPDRESLTEVRRIALLRIALICDISLANYDQVDNQRKTHELVCAIANFVSELPDEPDSSGDWVDGVFEDNSLAERGRKTYEGIALENSGITV